MKIEDRIIVALDVNNLDKAKKLVRDLLPIVSAKGGSASGGKFFKIGLEMINTGQAPELINFIARLKGKVFYDAKLNDIPNTVGRAVKEITRFGVWGLTVHASSGKVALREAIKNKDRSKIFGVTVLTSMDDEECKSIFGGNTRKKVLEFVNTLHKENCDGIVCSSGEAKFLRGFKKFDNLTIVTPGIRPLWASSNDQKRATTPMEALRAGADYLVIGRPITNPPKEIGGPREALDRIIEEI